ncbi:recombinase family protein (plasmid) [Streptomyces sp. NBC_00440]|uniref:recombinase family protein n=1 Tax=unclassified Streptomyces TaxID=2593676 RepID=UPI002E1AC7D6|nr:recombinase family protein [Streptomyces sp. NBC_00963]
MDWPLRCSRRDLPHRPLHQGAPARETPACAHPRRPRSPTAGAARHPGTPAPAPVAPDTPSADIGIGYARCSTLTHELRTQLDPLAAKHISRNKIFSEKISARVRVRPHFEAALTTTWEIKAHAPHCRVIFNVYEMKRLGHDAAELTAPHRPRPGPGNARWPPPGDVRSQRLGTPPVRILRHDGRDRTREHPRSHPRRTRHRARKATTAAGLWS